MVVDEAHLWHLRCRYFLNVARNFFDAEVPARKVQAQTFVVLDDYLVRTETDERTDTDAHLTIVRRIYLDFITAFEDERVVVDEADVISRGRGAHDTTSHNFTIEFCWFSTRLLPVLHNIHESPDPCVYLRIDLIVNVLLRQTILHMRIDNHPFERPYSVDISNSWCFCAQDPIASIGEESGFE
jgi:hypothetical protein